MLGASVTYGARCTYCGATKDLVAHHKVPREYGGMDVRSNLEPVCRVCHPSVERMAKTMAAVAAIGAGKCVRWEVPFPRKQLGVVRCYNGCRATRLTDR